MEQEAGEGPLEQSSKEINGELKALFSWDTFGQSTIRIAFFFFSREKGGGREGEKEQEKHLLAASRMCPDWGLNPQPRHLPWPGIELATFHFVGWCPTKWATAVGAIVMALELGEFSLSQSWKEMTAHCSGNFGVDTFVNIVRQSLGVGDTWAPTPESTFKSFSSCKHRQRGQSRTNIVEIVKWRKLDQSKDITKLPQEFSDTTEENVT